MLRALPGIGDLLCAVPALRAVRAAHPFARVTLVGLPSSALLPQRFPELVDDVLVLDDPGLACRVGAAGQALARERFGIARFVRDWESLFAEVCGG